MKTVAKEVDKGKSVVFVEYTGNWSASIGAVSDAIRAEHGLLIHSTLSPEKAAALRELVEPAVEELGGEEAVADYEVETEGAPAEEAPAEEPAPRACRRGSRCCGGRCDGGDLRRRPHPDQGHRPEERRGPDGRGHHHVRGAREHQRAATCGGPSRMRTRPSPGT